MFDAHAAYLYDYCLSLIGNEAEAASATRVTLVAAFMLGGRLREPDRQRAWLFALARRECLSEMPTRRQPWIATPTPVRPAPAVNGASVSFADADTSEMPRQGFDAEIRKAVRILARELAPRRDLRLEVLNLVHRYGIVPSELPAILDISPDATQDLLAAARVMRSDEGSYDAPLAVLPASVWRETADVIFGAGASEREYREAIVADAGRLWAEGLPEEPASPPSTRKLAMTSAGLAAALLAPAALGACAYVLFAASPAAATRTHDVVTKPTATPGTSTSVSTKTVAHATTDKVHHKARGRAHSAPVSVHSLPPGSTGPTASVSPSHKTTSPHPKPSGSTPVINPSPSPSSSGSPSPSGGGSPSGGSSTGGQSPSGGPSSGAFLA
jgi:DNA-directed RNA polymerase specialized sigma24 family protein